MAWGGGLVLYAMANGGFVAGFVVQRGEEKSVRLRLDFGHHPQTGQYFFVSISSKPRFNVLCSLENDESKRWFQWEALHWGRF